MEKVIFACVHNAGRSQMAAAFFQALADSRKAKAISAGTEPDTHVHPEVVEVMREVGVDLRNVKPQHLTPDLARDATWLVTMGCAESCPVVPGTHRLDWPLPDPKGLALDRVRAIRDEIELRVRQFITVHGLGHSH